MRKNILVVGCSFSHHTINEYGKKDNGWPDWIKEELSDNLYVCNMSLPGASNELIKRIVTKKTIEEKWDYVIIQWSTIDRWDYPTCLDEHPIFVRYWPNGTNLGGKNEQFYKHYYSTYGAVIDTLENILFIQQLLNSEDIPYSMITIGNLFTLSITIEEIKKLINNRGDYYGSKEDTNVLEKMERIQMPFEDSDSLPFLLKKINYDKFLFTDDDRNPMGGGMLEWLYKEKNQYPKNNWHFDGEQSYEFFNEFIKPKILITNELI
jgi:hypothetical protein